jgi:hypothetical protein
MMMDNMMPGMMWGMGIFWLLVIVDADPVGSSTCQISALLKQGGRE